MDPISTALIAGVAKSVGSVGEKVIVDGYRALKALIQRKLGGESKLVKAVADLEAKPDSDGRKLTLEEEVKEAKASEDPEILQAAQMLLDKITAQPGGEKHIQKAVGRYIAQADRGGSAQVHVNQPKKSTS